LYVALIFDYSSFKNSCSEIIVIPNPSAFARLLDPILSPAIKKEVFGEIELGTFPPLSSINFSTRYETFQKRQIPQTFFLV